jgi:hypothetical protein
MSDLTTYRFIGRENHRETFENQAAGLLEPDGRLQAIADAWNNDAHVNREDWPKILRVEWPDLADLLDALTEDNDELS